ncbi:MAG: hypothetical protein AAF517_18850 [Planctomycetota bacterium]
MRSGLGSLNAKTAASIEDHAKKLGDAFLPGAQATLHRLTSLFTKDGDFDYSEKKREHVYSEALDHLTRVHAVIRHGRKYLTERLEDPDLKPETDTAIAAWLGHAWQLRELRDCGLVESNVELVQLAFRSYDDLARREYVDVGMWMNLSSGRIQLTENYRPYRAAKHIRSEDSSYSVAQVEELFVYPGEVNPRVRWDQMKPREAKKADLKKVAKFAHGEIAKLIKEVRSSLRSPLGVKQPVYAIRFQTIGRVGGEFALEDGSGQRLALQDDGAVDEPKTCESLAFLPAEFLKDQTAVVRFRHDLDSGELRAKPLSIVSASNVVRLAY